MQYISIFLDIANFADFLQKKADVSRAQSVCHMIYIFIYFFMMQIGYKFYNVFNFHSFRQKNVDHYELDAVSSNIEHQFQ